MADNFKDLLVSDIEGLKNRQYFFKIYIFSQIQCEHDRRFITNRKDFLLIVMKIYNYLYNIEYNMEF